MADATTPPAAPPAAPAPAAAPPAPTVPPTALTEPPGPPPAAPQPSWPDNWRQLAAKGDEKALKRLERFGSPTDVVESLFNAQERISKGNIAKVLPENPTEDDVKAYREANGIPDKPENYKLELGELKVDDGVKGPVDAYLKAAHEAHTPPAQVNAAVKAFLQARTDAMAQRQQQDVTVAKETVAQLRQEYGAAFEVNVSLLKTMCETGPTGTYEKLSAARLADGTPLLSDPDSVRWLVNLARKTNPVMSVMGGSGLGPAKAMADEIGQLETMMRDPASAYFKGPDAEKHQARYRELITARDAGKS